MTIFISIFALGFYGEACEYMACGGGVSNPCNGHGRYGLLVMSMKLIELMTDV